MATDNDKDNGISYQDYMKDISETNNNGKSDEKREPRRFKITKKQTTRLTMGLLTAAAIAFFGINACKMYFDHIMEGHLTIGSVTGFGIIIYSISNYIAEVLKGSVADDDDKDVKDDNVKGGK